MMVSPSWKLAVMLIWGSRVLAVAACPARPAMSLSIQIGLPKTGGPSEDEEDMLDLAFGLTKTSRLGCQIEMSNALDGLRLTVPEDM